MNKNIVFFVGAVLSSWLLYNESLGLNALLFTIVLHILIIIQSPIHYKRPDIKFFGVTSMVSAIAVFLNGAPFSIGIWVACLFIFIGSFSGMQNSTYVRFLNGIYVSALGIIHQRFDNKKVSSTATLEITAKEKHTGFIIFTIVITILIVALFSYLYAQANTQFAAWMNSIDLSFISFGWVSFTVLSFYILKNTTSIAELDLITIPERALDKNLIPPIKISQKENERYSILGIVLITALCILISLFLFADITSINEYAHQNGNQLSQAVHKGVNALIISIVLAITILIVLFKGDFNFYKKNKTLKFLSVVWIVLNILLVLITAYKNYEYSSNFGLTYKRIGVGFYLTLCISGLITAYLKIFRLKKIVYLFQTNAAVLFSVLLLASTVNWSRTVTSFNLSHLENPDINYLLTLNTSNSALLKQFAKENPYIQQIPIITSRFQEEEHALKNASWKEFTLRNFTK